MTLAAGQTAVKSTPELRVSHDVPDNPEERARYVDQTVLYIGKQGFIPFKNSKGEILCSRLLEPLGKDDMTFCSSCHNILDVILAASRTPTSVPAVS